MPRWDNAAPITLAEGGFERLEEIYRTIRSLIEAAKIMLHSTERVETRDVMFRRVRTGVDQPALESLLGK